MKVKHLIEWLSRDFRPDDDVVALVWGKEIFPHYDCDTDTETPLTDEQWADAVAGAEKDEAIEHASSTVYETISEYVTLAKGNEVKA